MTGFYQRDLAAAHAAGFSGLSLAGGALVLDSLRASGMSSGAVVDLGCGSGEWATLAATHGFDVVGVDVSADMIELARARTPGARFVTASLWDYEITGPVVAVTAFGEALTYGAPVLPTAADLLALCRHVSVALVPGGVFVFDVIVKGDPMRYRTWMDGDDHAVLVDVSEDQPNSTLTRSVVVFARDVAVSREPLYRRSYERHVVRVYEQPDVEQALASAGLSWTTMPAYRDLALGPRRLAFIARRQAG